MTKEEYMDAFSDYGADVAAGKLTSEQAEATVLLRGLGNSLPSSLRSPLRAVMDGTEIPGTGDDVLTMARGLLLESVIARS